MSVFPGLSIGANSMENAANALQIVGNNLANLNTPGFKRSRAMQSTAFSSLLPAGSAGNQIGHGALGIQSQRVVTQGANERTGVHTDVAIDGNGWFILRNPATTEVLYSRAGNFQLDGNRFLVHTSGARVQGFEVNPAGAVSNTLTDIAVASFNSLGTPTTLVELKGNINSSAPILGAPPTFTSAAKRDEFIVVQGVNDQIAFQMNQGGPLITASLVANGGLVSGAAVSGAAVANALKLAIEAQNGVIDTYDVTYNQPTDRFRIGSPGANANTIKFLHDDAASTASALLGFAAVPSANIGPKEEEVSDLGVAFNILAGVNNTLSVLIDGTPATVTIAAGNYTGQELAHSIGTALRNTSSQFAGVRISYNESGALDQFVLRGPLTGGAHTINQPSNPATPAIAVPATRASVTGGTLAATTGFGAGAAAGGTGFFDIGDPFATSSANTSVQVVDGLGVQHALTIFLRKIGVNAWEWHGALKGADLTGPTPGIFFEEVASGFLRFDAEGRLLSEATTAGTGVFNFDQVGGGAVPPANQAINFNFGDSILTEGGAGLTGMTQFDNSPFTTAAGGENRNTLALTTALTNGVPAGVFVGFRIGDDGFVRVDFSNGHDQAIFLLPVALFPAQDQLTALPGNLFRQTNTAGTPVVTAPLTNGAGKLLAQSLERSNIESAEQFGEMILQQQVFQANSRVITTANDLLESLINIV